LDENKFLGLEMKNSIEKGRSGTGRDTCVLIFLFDWRYDDVLGRGVYNDLSAAALSGVK